MTGARFWQWPIWDLAFRPLFLLAAGGSVLSLAAWLALLNGWFNWRPALMSSVLWHIHEMVFAFALTVAVGFLLTAVQTWTQQRSLHGKPLFLLVLTWLLLRLLLWQPWWSGVGVMTLVLSLQLAWWCLVLVSFAKSLWRANNRRNAPLLLLLVLLASAHGLFLWAAVLSRQALALHVVHTVLLLFAVMIAIIAGRIIPLFTANGCRQLGMDITIRQWPWLDRLALISSLLVAVLFASQWWWPNTAVLASMLLMSAGLHGWRFSGWSFWRTANSALLWSLHLAYACLVLGYMALAFSLLSESLRWGLAMHLFTVGTIGLMILSMMCRVSLGHTGRPLRLPSGMAWALVALVLAMLARFLLPWFGWHLAGWNLSAFLWCGAFLMFCGRYQGMLRKKDVAA